jgi:uncharacterized membrane protein YcaP (DUF421 family)
MSDLLTTWSNVGTITIRAVCVYAFIMVGFRITGKREVGQLAPFDFALILLISNAVQNAMVGPDTSLVGGMVAASALLTINYVLGRVTARNRKVERLLRGRARILINRGHLDEESFRSERVSHEDLMQALRENGCATVQDCRLAVLEVDGTISVIQNHRGTQG